MKTAEIADERRIRIESSAKRIRAYLGGIPVADTTRPILVWEKPYYPTYYFPAEDVRTDLLTADGEPQRFEELGEGRPFTVKAGGKEAFGAALRYEDSPIEELHDVIRLDWEVMDAWFEEDEEVFTHPRDPYTRIDILASSRHVRVEVEGVEVADSTGPRLLFETGLPVRYYLPKPHVRMDLLVPSDTVTHCPYKGRAEHWSMHVGDQLRPDLAWTYPAPLPDSVKIAGLVAFYNEKVDLYVDGELQERPSKDIG